MGRLVESVNPLLGQARSQHHSFDRIRMMTPKTPRVVLRFAEMLPAAISRYEMHRKRSGGDLTHIDAGRSSRNQLLIGDEQWAAKAIAEIQTIKEKNFEIELEGLRKRRRTAEIKKRIKRGPKDPWKSSRRGPLREVILSASPEWFEGEDGSRTVEDTAKRTKVFEDHAIRWLKKTFGDDVVHARADLDEGTYHIHAVIVPKKRAKNGSVMLQPSIYPELKDYETAQDSVGKSFSVIGICRGKRSKAEQQKVNDYNAENFDPPEHKNPAKWRKERERTLAIQDHRVKQRERKVAARELNLDEAVEVVRAYQKDDQKKIEAARQSEKPHIVTIVRVFDSAFERMKQAAKRAIEGQMHAVIEKIRKLDDLFETRFETASQRVNEVLQDEKALLRAQVTKIAPSIFQAGSKRKNRDQNDR